MNFAGGRQFQRALGVLWALMAATRAAQGGDPNASQLATARALFAAAEQAEARNDWAVALDKLRAVVAIKETAGVRFHLAAAEERLDQLLAADDDFHRAIALATPATSENDRDVLARANERVAALAGRVPTLTLVVTTEADRRPRVHVRVNGRDLAPNINGYVTRLDPGEARVDIEADGYRSHSESLVVSAGQHPVVRVALESLTPSVASSPPSVTTTSRPHTDRVSPHTNVALTWTAAGVALTAAGVGTAYFFHGRSLTSDTTSACDQHAACDRDDRNTAYHRANVWAAVFGGVGVAAGGVAVWSALHASDESPGASVGVRIGPAGGALVVRY